MTRIKIVAIFLSCALAFTVFSGCNDDSSGAGQALAVERLAVIGAQIYATPDQQSEILSNAGLTEAGFRDAIADLALSIEKSRRYQQAFEAELDRLGVAR